MKAEKLIMKGISSIVLLLGYFIPKITNTVIQLSAEQLKPSVKWLAAKMPAVNTMIRNLCQHRLLFRSNGDEMNLLLFNGH